MAALLGTDLFSGTGRCFPEALMNLAKMMAMTPEVSVLLVREPQLKLQTARMQEEPTGQPKAASTEPGSDSEPKR